MFPIRPKPLQSNIAPAVLAAIISGGAAVASGVGSGVLSSVNADKQHQHQLDYMDKSIDANIQHWNRENAYNTPEQQMKRFKDAGLNPNLMVGQTNTASGMTPSGDVPEAQLPRNSVMDGINSMSAMADIALKQAQVKKIEQDTQLSDAREQAVLHGMYLADENLNLRFMQFNQKDKDLAVKWARMARLNEKTDAEKKVLTQQIENLIQQKNESIKKVELMDAQEGLYVAQKIKQDFDNEHLDETWNLFRKRAYAEIAKMRSETELNKSTKAQVDEDIKFLRASLDNRLQRLVNELDLQDDDMALKEEQLRNLKAELIASLDDVYRNSAFANEFAPDEADEFNLSGNSRTVAATVIDVVLQTFGFSSGANYHTGRSTVRHIRE